VRQVRVDIFAAVENRGKQLGQVVNRARDVGVEDVFCGFDARAWALPCFDLCVFGPHVQMESVFVVVELFDYSDRILLEEAGEVAEVGVLVEFVEDGARSVL
jgi:hypothetical protein